MESDRELNALIFCGTKPANLVYLSFTILDQGFSG